MSVAPDPHLNIFFAYRGASSSDEAAARQLEDNLTRALIITLNTIRDQQARTALLRALGFTDLPPADDRVRCDLQVTRPQEHWPASSRRRLLVIHGGPTLDVIDSGADHASGRADAVVIAGDSMVVIESKLSNIVEQAQLDRHRQALEIPSREVLDVTWTQLARAVESIRLDARIDPLGSFILEQFGAYLMLNGFGDLSEDHFSFFAVPVEDRDPFVKDGIRRILGEIGDAVVARVGADWTRHLLNITERSTGAGVVLEPGERGRHPHLTIALEATGIMIFANVELEPAYRRFVRSFAADPTGFIDIVKTLGQERIATAADVPWEFTVRRRVPLPQPRQYHYWTSLSIGTRVLAEWPDDLVIDLVRRAVAKPEGEAAPEILIGRSYPSSMMIRNERVEDILINDARQLEQFFNWIGMPLRKVAPE